MRVEPYVRWPKQPPRIALLTEGGRIVSEDGDRLEPGDLDRGWRLYVSHDLTYQLVHEGLGEGLRWRSQYIRWRHARLDRDGWVSRPSDALVLGLPLEQLPTEEILRGLARWRDWLWSYRAVPSTTGSAAWSLLRARLERGFWTGHGSQPPLRFTVGGRQEIGPRGRGRFEHGLAQLDMPAAYASTLASLRYGGVWQWCDPGTRFDRRFVRFAEQDDHPAFVRARVRLADGWPGPLLRRPRKAPRRMLDSLLFANDFPTGGRIQGVWTWQELEAAERGGAHVEQLLGGWIHRSGRHPFVPWWDAILEGRRMPGLAGVLAKLTGNALWGRFCMDPRAGRRTVVSRIGRRRTRSRVLPGTGNGQWPAHDLAETVSGRVRARLYLAMLEAGPDLVTAHTDGLWVDGATPRIMAELPELRSWRVKERARALELIGPQTLRYWPRRSIEPTYSVAGIPTLLAPEFFEDAWARQEAM